MDTLTFSLRDQSRSIFDSRLNLSDYVISNINYISSRNRMTSTPTPNKNKKYRNKCYSARKGLKRESITDSITIDNVARKYYKSCRHCAWYSMHFPDIMSETIVDSKVIENNDDFEKVKKQFVRHMNRSHPDICKRKLMKKFNNKDSLI